MRKAILLYLQQEIDDRCQKDTNKFGMGCYYHIAAVVQNAEILAAEYGTDKEIVIDNKIVLGRVSKIIPAICTPYFA